MITGRLPGKRAGPVRNRANTAYDVSEVTVETAHPTLPEGTRVTGATARGLNLLTHVPFEKGTALEFELLLGARPVEVVARVQRCVAEVMGGFTLDVEFLAMAQVDRDIVADFLQAVGPTALRVRPRPAR